MAQQALQQHTDCAGQVDVLDTGLICTDAGKITTACLAGPGVTNLHLTARSKQLCTMAWTRRVVAGVNALTYALGLKSLQEGPISLWFAQTTVRV